MLSLCSLSVRSQYPGPDGSSTGPIPNHSVPCRHFSGTWSDNFGTSNTYQITSSLVNNSLSGTANIAHPGGSGCPRVNYQISGSITPTGGIPPFIRGTTTYALHITNPDQGLCNQVLPVPVNFSGDLRNDGCDIAVGTWVNVGAPGTGSISFSKPADLPTGESTTPVGWASAYPTVQQFRQELSGSNSNRPFDGRQVTEAAGSSQGDTCFIPGGPLPPPPAPQVPISPFGVTGGWWSVGRYATPPLHLLSNYWIDDYVGLLPYAVEYYRAQGKAPCDAWAQQFMKACSNGNNCVFSQQYRSTFISAGLTSTQVYSGRDTHVVIRNWP
jgi:hypothetical protein